MALPISYGASKAARLASAQEFLPSGFGASSAAAASGSSSTARYYNQLSDQISKITAQNNAWSAAQAAQQMAFRAVCGPFCLRHCRDALALAQLAHRRSGLSACPCILEPVVDIETDRCQHQSTAQHQAEPLHHQPTHRVCASGSARGQPPRGRCPRLPAPARARAAGRSG